MGEETNAIGNNKNGKSAGPSPSWSSTQAYGLALICLLLGSAIGFLAHKPAQPADTATQATAVTPADSADPHAAMGQITPEQLKQMADKKAAPLLDQLKQNPNDASVLSQLGDIYTAAHQFNEAAGYYEKSATIKPDANVLTQLASAYYYSGSADKAIDTLNRALQVNPKFANALFNLGMLDWQTKGDAQAAIANWEKLLKTNPNHPHRAEVEHMIAEAKQHMNRSKIASN